MTEFYDGPGVHAPGHYKGADTQNTRRMEIENKNLSQEIESLKSQHLHLREDLKRANTDLLHYKDRTQGLQKQVSGLKSGKYKPDQVPEFKTPNPNQQIIKALIKENEELKKRIELLKEIKDKVKTNASSMDQSDLYDALTYLEEENKNLRSQLNLGGETSEHSIIGKESENIEIAKLKEKLQISLNWSRDLSDHNATLKKELDKALVGNINIDPTKRIVDKDPMVCISRTPEIPASPYSYQQMPTSRPPARMVDPINFKQYPGPYVEHSPITPNWQDSYPYTESIYQQMHTQTPPTEVIMPQPPLQGASALHQKEHQRTGQPPYNSQGPYLGYK
ncbi:hypothetical protein LOD99_4654 [Oopsacas minuta]|uniref:Uncharacterized protein n=1 Tax=Oopsacas minuta TaxID=111878 RepID=A0AAV7JT90_9METZ|nr:hypothetical protein LOD99_4654 [Oopsacas minuta]